MQNEQTKTEKKQKVVGTFDERTNRMFRMVLEWQYDRGHGIKKPSSFYFGKYHVGKYSKNLFADLDYVVIDRNYVLNKLSQIKSMREIRDKKHNKIQRQPDLFQSVGSIETIPTEELINELTRRGFNIVEKQ